MELIQWNKDDGTEERVCLGGIVIRTLFDCFSISSVVKGHRKKVNFDLDHWESVLKIAKFVNFDSFNLYFYYTALKNIKDARLL